MAPAEVELSVVAARKAEERAHEALGAVERLEAELRGEARERAALQRRVEALEARLGAAAHDGTGSPEARDGEAVA